MTDELETLRARIGEVRDDLAALDAEPPSHDDLRAGLRRRLERGASEHAERLKRNAPRYVAGDVSDLLPLPVHDSRGLPSVVDVAPALALLLGLDRACALFDPYLTARPDGMPAADRAALRADYLAELDALELAEEAEIRRLQAAGEDVTRRADARPECVLALDDDAEDASTETTGATATPPRMPRRARPERFTAGPSTPRREVNK